MRFACLLMYGTAAVLESLKNATGIPKIYLALGVLILVSVVVVKAAGFPAFW